MPVYSWRLPESSAVPLGMEEHPIRVPVSISLHPAGVRFLAESGLPIPTAVTGEAMFDTAATRTAIDLEITNALQLRPNGVASLVTLPEPLAAATYAFEIGIYPGLRLPCVQGIGLDLQSHGIIALIGMDLLSKCVMTLNGPGGTLALAV